MESFARLGSQYETTSRETLTWHRLLVVVWGQHRYGPIEPMTKRHLVLIPILPIFLHLNLLETEHFLAIHGTHLLLVLMRPKRTLKPPELKKKSD